MAEVEERMAANRAPDNPVLIHSPVGRVPTLVVGELVITEARYIYDFLTKKSTNPDFVSIPPLDVKAVSQEGQILGFMDGIACWVRENRREISMRSMFLVDVERDRSLRCLMSLERVAQKMDLPDFATFRGMALAAGLDLMQFNGFHPDWQAKHPHLAGWFSEVKLRRSMIETAPE